jgi:adenosine deaminase CECR1
LLLGATRIGLGINLLSDPATYLLMKNREYLIEISLLSNQVLEYVPDIQQHPFPEYLRTGIPVSLNTDDRGSWDSNITDEFYTAVTEFNLTWNEVCEITRNSLRYSFVEPAVKARLLRLHEAALRQAETRLLSGGAGVSDKPAVISGYAKRRWGL